MTFWLRKKIGLIREISLISKFMTSEPGQQTIAAIDIQRKWNQLIEYNKRNIFLQILCRKWGRETSSRLFFIFKKCLKETQTFKAYSTESCKFPINIIVVSSKKTSKTYCVLNTILLSFSALLCLWRFVLPSPF